MAKTKEERIASVEKEIVDLANLRKRLLQEKKAQERKARTKRLIERGAIAESLIDGAAELDNESFKTLLEQALRPSLGWARNRSIGAGQAADS